MAYDALAKRPKVYDIHPATVAKLNKMVREARSKPGFKLSNGPIDDIPRYDWAKDPNNYCDEKGQPPYNRCHHCGYQYNQATGFTAHCNICLKALKYMEGGVLTHREQQRTRVPDGKKPVSLVEVNSI